MFETITIKRSLSKRAVFSSVQFAQPFILHLRTQLLLLPRYEWLTLTHLTSLGGNRPGDMCNPCFNQSDTLMFFVRLADYFLGLKNLLLTPTINSANNVNPSVFERTQSLSFIRNCHISEPYSKSDISVRV